MRKFVKPISISIALVTSLFLVASIIYITINTATSNTATSPVSYWQTYYQSAPGIHKYLVGDFDYKIEKIPKPSPNVQAGHMFVAEGKLIAHDRSSGKQWVLQSDGDLIPADKSYLGKVFHPVYHQFSYTKGDHSSVTACLNSDNSDCSSINLDSRAFLTLLATNDNSEILSLNNPPSYYSKELFSSSTHLFSYIEGGPSIVIACLISNKSECSSIDMDPGTWPYVFATKDNSAIAFPNAGSVGFLFKDGVWCRMNGNVTHDFWSCDNPPNDQKQPIQFYSSVLYQGKVLLGEWPTGRIFEFDGTTIKLSDMTPPFTNTDPLGYEAQAMAEYCGDLFVGYWPKGEVWRWSSLNENWTLFHRFFTETPNESFIPHKNRTADDFHPAYFGQRVPSLVPFDDALYVTTANLYRWNYEEGKKIIGESLAAEYGSIYKITRFGCNTIYSDPK